MLCLKQNIRDVLGISDIWRCSCRLHQGRVGPAGHIPAKAVQGCHAGKYTSSRLPRWVCQRIHLDRWVGGKVVGQSARNRTASAYPHTPSTLFPESFIDLTWKKVLFILLQLVCHTTRIYFWPQFNVFVTTQSLTRAELGIQYFWMYKQFKHFLKILP